MLIAIPLTDWHRPVAARLIYWNSSERLGLKLCVANETQGGSDPPANYLIMDVAAARWAVEALGARLMTGFYPADRGPRLAAEMRDTLTDVLRRLDSAPRVM